MKVKLIIILTISFLLIISPFFIYQNFILAASAPPTVTFSGDDILQNGGTDDAYDTITAIDITQY